MKLLFVAGQIIDPEVADVATITSHTAYYFTSALLYFPSDGLKVGGGVMGHV